jgi:hypothetical protein
VASHGVTGNEVSGGSCGTGVAASRFGCIRQDLFENEEIYEEIEGILA